MKMNNSWTILLYMSGDNSLDEMIPRNLGLLKSMGSTENMTILALCDRRGDSDTELLYIDFHETKQIPLTILDPEFKDELNLGESRTLERLVTWSMDNYKTDRYCLILWGHGRGWSGVALDGNDFVTMPEPAVNR